ncbi:sulfotransferase domain-containing protein [Paracoccus sp. S1E-3]|uniref:sulfotransferase domain-containing protein n=1 Tax=Paracoccus sp. S1E-3 TaxID=2756130 RepID=UPI0015EEB535|nr:sulfotransferase domain-containing protein [Paracoccus sp. S1E-3]MBA4490064.1 sulfotransferase domain-containing protein [Paracoccus sp. S1E-3]
MNLTTGIPRYVWKRATNSARLFFHIDRIDAVLASYPKSGRTWFRFILSSYLVRLFGLNPALDLYSTFTVMPNFDLDPERGLPAFGFADHKPPVPLIAVSHRPYSRLWFRQRPIIYMLRDPRDVLVSSYFHATRQKHRFSGDIDAFLNDPAQGIAALTGYLNGWAAGLRHNPHIVLSYEKLSQDPISETARVLDFLGVEVRPDLLADAVEAARFQNMQKLELSKGLPGHDYDRSDGESLRMRKGQVGGYVDYLSPAQIALIDAACDRRLNAEARALLAQTRS